ncbi:MAG: DMT family transporter [Alphaproteobacteria bacterium]|nr:DMT family transporter [Alphaproteobacteria bacterium]
MSGPPAWMTALAAAGSTILGGSALVAMRYAVPESDALAVSLWRQVGPALLFGGFALAIRQRMPRFARRDLMIVIAISTTQYCIVSYLMTASLAYITAARGALVMSTMPLAALGVGALLGSERFTLLKTAGIAVALGGIVVAIGDDASAGSAEAWKGDLLMLAATAWGGLNTVLVSPYLRRYGALPVAAIAGTVGMVACFAAVAAFGQVAAVTSFSASGWIAVLWLAVPGGAASLYLWIWSLRHATPGRVTVAISLNPISAAVLGAAALGEAVTPHILIGLIGVVAGIVLAYWPSRGASES